MLEHLILLVMVISYWVGYVPAARWLFYSDRMKQEAIDEKFALAAARADEKYEREIEKWRQIKAEWNKKNSDRWGDYPSYPTRNMRDLPDPREYKSRSRQASNNRALTLALAWPFILFAICLMATPTVIGKILFKRLTPYEREQKIAEIDRTIAELEKTELKDI